VLPREALARESTDGTWCERHYRACACAVLCLAAFNVSFRLTQENVAEWDESLYAVSAIEMLRSNDWVGTTSFGVLDYSNSKPPLNVWLIALSFKALGTNLLSLRLVAAASAWLTVLAVLLWARRTFGASVALCSALVLSTSFGFLHVHSGRSGNPDALMTLLMLLTVVVEWAADRRPLVLAWLGPLLAGVFLLKGMAVLMPLAFVIAVEAWRARRGHPVPWMSLVLAAVLFALPVASWTVARWRVDEWRFLRLLVTQDLVALSAHALDGHRGSPLYYLDVLQRHHYDWLLAAAVAIALWRPWSRRVPTSEQSSWDCLFRRMRFWQSGSTTAVVLGFWVLIVLGVPAMMQTKLQWYLNPFYPVFALGVGWLVAGGLCRPGLLNARARLILLAVVGVAAGVAEARLLWHSVYQRALAGSAQELVMMSADEVRGRVVYRNAWTRGEVFAVRGIAQAETATAPSVDAFLASGAAGSVLLADAALADPRLVPVRSVGAHALYRRR
jgi:4-amino-4-deoxy-L-arabinose transferase-like glycosyltransferase